MEHVNAEILRAIADGKKVQYRHTSSGWEFFDCSDGFLCWKLLKGSAIEWRIAPKTIKTIKIGEYEVPEPCREPLHSKQRFWVVNLFIGPQHFTWDGSKEDYHALNCGFVHLTEEAAQQHYEAIKSLLA